MNRNLILSSKTGLFGTKIIWVKQYLQVLLPLFTDSVKSRFNLESETFGFYKKVHHVYFQVFFWYSLCFFIDSSKSNGLVASDWLDTVHILADTAHDVDIIQQVRRAVLPRAKLITIGQLIRIEHGVGWLIAQLGELVQLLLRHLLLLSGETIILDFCIFLLI